MHRQPALAVLVRWRRWGIAALDPTWARVVVVSGGHSALGEASHGGVVAAPACAIVTVVARMILLNRAICGMNMFLVGLSVLATKSSWQPRA